MGMDYENSSTKKLFIKQLIPNILGMAFSALFIIVDGIFVGRGIGSDALAAINIAAPIFAIMTGVGLMFGLGAAILATVALSRNKQRYANIIITQSTFVATFIMLIYSIVAVIMPEQIVLLFGSPADLVKEASEYLSVMSLFSIFLTALVLLPYFVRIISPNYALFCLSTATVINLVLDYLFIIQLKWGLFGAALATGIGELSGVVLLLVYLIRNKKGLRLTSIPITLRSMRFAWKGARRVAYLGFPVLLSELTISVMAIAGNYTFGHYIGVDGIAAFSIVNYMFPVIYMVYNAIAQSGQPIISYNYGKRRRRRCCSAFRLSLITALAIGALFMLLAIVFRVELVSLFIPDRTDAAWQIAVDGVPYFSLEFIPFGINVLYIGYYMSIKQGSRALIYTSIRGVLPVFCFALLPLFWGIPGVWLAEPMGEIISAAIILLTMKKLEFKS